MEDGAQGDIYARRYWILAAIMLGGIMGPIDASIVNVTLPTIAQHYGAELSTAQWVPMIYLLVISSLLLLFGRLGDIIGYRKVYLAGLGGFTLASAMCSATYFLPTIHWLIAFRAVQGLTASMLMAVQIAIITASFPSTERGKALGINAISISAGLAIGPSIGGFLTHSFGWPSVFLVNVPIGIVGLLWARHILPELKGRSGSVDWLGAAASFVSLLTFLLFVNSVQRSGFEPAALAMLLIAAVAAVLFIRTEGRAPSPLIDLALFRKRTFVFANASALLNFMAQYVMVFLTPFYLQRLLHCAPNDVGLIMTAFPLAMMATAPFSGSLSDRVGTRTLACVGAAICAIALLLMSLLPISATPRDIAWRLALFGIGTGIFQSPNNSAVMGSAPRPHFGTASGILATVRNIGMVLGIATGGAVLYALVPVDVLQALSLTDEAADRFLYGSRYAYFAGAILTAIAAVMSLIGRDGRRAG